MSPPDDPGAAPTPSSLPTASPTSNASSGLLGRRSPLQPPVGLVLAGGRSSRFGSEKALHRWRGAPLIQHVLEALDEGVAPSALLVAVGALEEHPLLIEALQTDPRADRLRPLPDPPDIQGPLAGLAAGLRAAHGHSDLVMACACDMPALTPGLLAGLLKIARMTSAPAVAPRVAGRFEPLCALYRPAGCLDALEHYAQTGRRSLQGLLEALPEVRVVDEAELSAMEPGWRRALANINRLDDLERL